MPHRSCTAQSLSIAAQILRCRGTFFFCYSGAIFERSRSLSIDYSGAKYARSVPKIDLAWNHFFEQLKTAVLLIDCETATLKSLPSRGSDASHVHPRPRKRPPRCTLDCGFKTSESPALRGFVGERCPIRGTSLYLVLKSNGLRHSKNLPVKFGFSSKPIPTNIAKKLPSQRCSKSLFITFFNFSHKRPTFAFTDESVYTLGFRRRIAHKGTHGETGAFPPSSTARPCTASEIATERTAGESGCTPYGVCPLPTAPQPRWAALPRLQFGGAAFFRSAFGTFCMCEARGVSPLSACSTCRRNARCPLVKAANSPFPCLARFFFDSSSAKYCPLSLQMPKGPAGYPLVLSLLFASPYLP